MHTKKGTIHLFDAGHQILQVDWYDAPNPTLETNLNNFPPRTFSYLDQNGKTQYVSCGDSVTVHVVTL